MWLSTSIDRFRLDRALLAVLALGALALAARIWLHDHPQHNPWAPLDLRHPPGWATQAKIAELRNDPGECRAMLERSEVAFTSLSATGEGECRRENRLILTAAPLGPESPQTTCPVAAGLELWMRHGVQPAARATFGSPVTEIEHLGAYSCRRIYGGSTGNWSEHATGNAIDIATFVLEDGQRISLRNDWSGSGSRAAFLRAAREEACKVFGTVLSPDYNAAHADHFHLDQARRSFGAVCR